ncbi:ribbon-helix-helix domain-containing protein [Sphingobium sp. ZW T5_29]|uniref:ribbon-helix-helix domain-containing protein n=1 Tax=Sphingobium sp. ZW T5_29 TaxID=3378077 RepID=UPI003854D30E
MTANGDLDGDAPPPASPFAAPVKRSITIAGHQTAISLEPIFWDALRVRAASEGLPINALIARIDVARLAVFDPPNLASAVRCWLFSLKEDKNSSQ